MHPLHRVASLLDLQDGVLSRRQLLDADVAPHEIARLVRRREAVLVGRGVLVTHTGPPTWRQRVWAAMLSVSPSAADRHTAVALAAGREQPSGEPIHLAVDERRRVDAPSGAVVHRRSGVDDLVAWNARPPRVRLEVALLDVAASRRRRIDGFADLADALGSRLTTADRLRSTLDARARIIDRRWWEDVVADLAGGTHSVLEHGYLTFVERPHGLPRGDRQVRRSEGDRVTYSDVEYDTWGVRVELDGFAMHRDRRQRDRDLHRDVLARLGGDTSLRLGWGHVYEQGCWTAGAVARVLRRRGWPGRARRCSAACTAVDDAAA